MNQLIQARVSLGFSSNALFSYDHEGKRIHQEVLSIARTADYFYMGANVHYDTGPGGGVITYGPGDDAPLAMFGLSDNPFDAGTMFHQDGIGSVVAKTGTAAGTQRFDAWGVTPATAPALFGYVGREAEPSGLYNMRARYYDPYMRRCIQRDPIGLAGGINQYTYAGNNPINYRDPSGLAPVGPSNTTGTSYPSGSSGCTSQLMPREKNTETDAVAEIDGIDFSNGPVVVADGMCTLNPQREILRASPNLAGYDPFLRQAAGSMQDGFMLIAPMAVPGARIAESFGGILSKIRGWFGAEAQAASALPDAALVCRGGACKAENVLNGKGVTQAVDGTLNGVSTQSRAGASVSELAQPFKNKQVGVTPCSVNA